MTLAQTHNELNDLRYVAAICAHGSLSGAARALAVNHATVFRRIVQLEKALGVRLFERDDGRYRPTPAGEELARAGAAMEDLAAEALRKVAGRDLRPSGSVRISTTDSVAQMLLNPVILQARLAYPDIQLEVVIDNHMANLSKRDADIALRPAREVPEHLIGKRLGTIEFAVYGSASYLRGKTRLPLAEHAWIALDEVHRTVHWLEQQAPRQGIGLRLNSFGAIAHACADGLGLAVLPCFLGDGTAKLKQLGVPIPECASSLWLLTHPDVRTALRVSVIYQLLSSAVAVRSALSAGPAH